MVIKDYGWIGLDREDILIHTPSIYGFISMTLMYVGRNTFIPLTLSC